MKKTNIGLVDYAKSKLTLPTIYMLGGFGRKLTQANIDRRVKELKCSYTINNLNTIKAGIGRYCFDCVVVNPDGNENIKPMKNKAKGRIDPICALVDAAGAVIKLEPKRSVYETRGLRSLA